MVECEGVTYSPICVVLESNARLKTQQLGAESAEVTDNAGAPIDLRPPKNVGGVAIDCVRWLCDRKWRRGTQAQDQQTAEELVLD